MAAPWARPVPHYAPASARAPCSLPAVRLRGIEHPFVIMKCQCQRRVGPVAHHCAIEARTPPGVARAGAGLLDPEPQHILIAVNAYLGDVHHVARGLAFLPEPPARAAVKP